MRFLIVVLSLLLITGCETYNASRYQASAQHTAVLKSLEGKSKVNVSGFTQAESVVAQTCRLAGPVNATSGKTYAKYIEEALITELSGADLYSPAASKNISAEITAVSFSSVSPAQWHIEAIFKSNGGSGEKVSTTYNFDTSWSAYGACRNASDSFAYAVEDLIKQYTNTAAFKSAIE